MDRETLLALAERCEKATGPDRELDQCIHEAVVMRAPQSDRGYPWAEKYSSSLDSATMLVPENSLFTVRTLWDRDKIVGFASVSRYELAGPNDQLRRYWMDENQACGATPALALATASLRALASTAPAGSSPSDESISSQVASMPDMPASSATSCQATEEGE